MKLILGNFAALLVSACVSTPPLASPPTEAEKATLAQASRDCGLNERTHTFAEESPYAWYVKVDRSFGDSEERISCAYQRLPDEFWLRFGYGPMQATLKQ